MGTVNIQKQTKINKWNLFLKYDNLKVLKYFFFKKDKKVD